jgi:hypothetical protein
VQPTRGEWLMPVIRKHTMPFGCTTCESKQIHLKTHLQSHFTRYQGPLSFLLSYKCVRSPTAWGSPVCIYSPDSVNSLVEAFKISATNDTKIAIRGQGHSPLRGWADIDDGITFVTQNLKGITYDHMTGNVIAEMGNTWGEVYEFTEPYGRIPNGARHFSVGLATVLGGMQSHIISQFFANVEFRGAFSSFQQIRLSS